MQSDCWVPSGAVGSRRCRLQQAGTSNVGGNRVSILAVLTGGSRASLALAPCATTTIPAAKDLLPHPELGKKQRQYPFPEKPLGSTFQMTRVAGYGRGRTLGSMRLLRVLAWAQHSLGMTA